MKFSKISWVRSWILGWLLSFALGNSGAFGGPELPWTVLRSWDARYEQMYSDFVRAIGRAQVSIPGMVGQYPCSPLQRCLNDPAINRYHLAPSHPSSDPHETWEADPETLRVYSDCADLPYNLRAYFAWKHHLPFRFTNTVRAGRPSDGIATVVAPNTHFDFPAPNGAPRSLNDAFLRFHSDVSTNMLRMDPRLDVLPTDPTSFPDFYSVRISPQTITPGTVIFNPNGHVAVVYDVDLSRGRILFMDAHPDNSLTRKTYGSTGFPRFHPSYGHGFKKWRPIRLEGDRIVGVPNADLPDYDRELVQFYGTERAPDGDWHGTFSIRGERVLDPPHTEYLRAYGGGAYYAWVDAMMSGGNFDINPILEVREKLGEICTSLQDRVTAVDLAIEAGIDRRRLPSGVFPHNIYGTVGEWETYSSPSRDARIKQGFKDLYESTRAYVEGVRAGNNRHLIYRGRSNNVGLTTTQVRARATGLLRDIAREYVTANRDCRLGYTRSDGTYQRLTIHDVGRRLFALSFDPYHCIERRWGAAPGSAELSSCRDDAQEEEWYTAEQYLRNMYIIDYHPRNRMEFDLNLMRAIPPSEDEGETWPEGPRGLWARWRNGFRTPPVVNVVAYLRAQPEFPR
jgi:hypothetical protein